MSGGRLVGMLCLLAPLLSGCGGRAVQKNQPDPLLGTNATPIPKDATGTAKGPAQPVPALTAPSAATSPAALASGAVPRLDGDRDLRIGAGADASVTSRGQSPGGVTLGAPSPPGATRDDRSLPAVPAVGPFVQTGATSAAYGSIDQMMRYLESRGVKGFRLEMQRETGQWRCTCSIPQPGNPTQKTTYITTDNATTDPQSALRAVVEQVQRDER